MAELASHVIYLHHPYRAASACPAHIRVQPKTYKYTQTHRPPPLPPNKKITRRCEAVGVHWVQECPTQGDSAFDKRRIRPPVGIPMTRLARSDEGGLVLPNGMTGTLLANEDAFAREILGLPTAAPVPTGSPAGSGQTAATTLAVEPAAASAAAAAAAPAPDVKIEDAGRAAVGEAAALMQQPTPEQAAPAVAAAARLKVEGQAGVEGAADMQLAAPLLAGERGAMSNWFLLWSGKKAVLLISPPNCA
jgi:hypothetical protein